MKSFAFSDNGIPTNMISEIIGLTTINLNLLDLSYLLSLAISKASSSDIEGRASNKLISKSIRSSANSISILHLL